MKHISEKFCRENQNTFHVQNFEDSAIYEIKWKNMVQPDRVQVAI
jgi:hypothetical protein